MPTSTKAEKQEARRELKKWLKPGSIVYTDLTHCGRNGMNRSIRLFAIKSNRPVYLDYWVSVLCDRTRDQKNSGLKIGGCGMDMGFALVYELGAALWPKGTRKAHSTRNGEPDHSGGYALIHRWL